MGFAAFLNEIARGDWFLPVTVKGQDQHALIPHAIARGAAGIFFEPGKFHPEAYPNVKVIEVPSVRETLFALALGARKNVKAKVAVVAGSNGKTSVKELLGAALRAEVGPERAHMSPENFNTKIHLASQILKLDPLVKLCAFEVGARHVGDFDIPLTLLQPEVVALLNIGTAHRGEFGGEIPQVQTKLSALGSPATKTVVVPAEDARILQHAQGLGKIVRTFGPGGEYRVENGELKGEGERYPIPVRNIPAWELNAAAAAALARAMGVSWSSVMKALGEETSAPGRFEVREWQGRVVVDDAFNSAPESLASGLSSFFAQFGDRKIALILGSMLELGPDGDRFHRDAGKALRGKEALLITVGEEARALGEEAQNPSWKHFSSAGAAIEFLAASEWKAAYLKSSRAVGLLGALSASQPK
jgi:UDP-N-acetylmuramoyl-tripeptide--D-alanyl-D-alanine ligase